MDVAWCSQCAYSLRGLQEPRCPECGRAFDPKDIASFSFGMRPSFFRQQWTRHRHWIIRATTFLICVGLSWFAFKYDYGRYSIFILAPAMYLLFRLRWVATILFLLSSPPTACTFSDCLAYSRGDALYVRPPNQVPWTQSGSLRPDSRIRGFDPRDCGMRPSNYWVSASAQAWAAAIMSKLTGPPPGAYLGAYPTLLECISLIRSSGQIQSTRDHEASQIRVGIVVYKLPISEMEYCILTLKSRIFHPGLRLFLGSNAWSFACRVTSRSLSII